jgi:hypothetical protein
MMQWHNPEAKLFSSSLLDWLVLVAAVFIAAIGLALALLLLLGLFLFLLLLLALFVAAAVVGITLVVSCHSITASWNFRYTFSNLRRFIRGFYFSFKRCHNMHLHVGQRCA